MTARTLHVIVGSTRPGRVGLPVACWVVERALQHGAFDVEMIDLAKMNLPFLDEPLNPRQGKYEHEHTKQWSAIVQRADAFVLVMPEYNSGFNPALKNALDFLHAEWKDKPVAFVSYGGPSGGIRAVQMLRAVVVSLGMVPLAEGVAIHQVKNVLDENGAVQATPAMDAGADAMFDELFRKTELLFPLP